MTSHVNYDIRALEKRARNQWRDAVAELQPKKPTIFDKVLTVIAYGAMAAAVGYAVFVVTPAHSAGSMATDVRIIHVTPRVAQIDKKAAAEAQKQQGRMELENLKSANRRQLESDKAYYSKLKDQRKHK